MTYSQPFALALGREHVRGFFIAYAIAAATVRLGFGSVADEFGRDRVSLASLAAYGAVGVVGVSSHWTGRRQRDLWDAVAKGDFTAARSVNADLLASFEYMNNDTCVFSQAVKVALTELGLTVGECRLPLGPPPPDTAARARRVLTDLGYQLS